MFRREKGLPGKILSLLRGRASALTEHHHVVGLIMRALSPLSMLPIAALLLTFVCFGQEPTQPRDDGVLEPVSVKKDLYPANADATKEIDEALKDAAAQKKRVLLIFGGNWCYDCHVLDRALHEGEAGKVLKESFLLVHVDIGEGDKNLDLVKKYKTTLDLGVPVVVILSSDGSALYSSDGGQFEAARTMMKKDLLLFLKHWRGKRQ